VYHREGRLKRGEVGRKLGCGGLKKKKSIYGGKKEEGKVVTHRLSPLGGLVFQESQRILMKRVRGEKRIE